MWRTAHAALSGAVQPGKARFLHLVDGFVKQQHVAGEAGRSCHALDKVKEDVIGLALVQVGQFTWVGDLVLQLDHAEGPVSLRLDAGCQAVEISAPIASQVVPQHFDAIPGHRESVVTGIGKTAQAVTAINFFSLYRAGLDDRVDVCRQRSGAMCGVDRDLVAARVTLEHRQLACRQLVLVLFGGSCRDDEQGLFVGKRVTQKSFAVHGTRRCWQASGPGRDTAVGVRGFDSPYWRQRTAQLCGLLGRDLGHNGRGQKRKRQGAGLHKYSCCFHVVALTFRNRLEMHSCASATELRSG
ncbi:hypothetical protein D3C84_725840 [compost metagenome]